MKENFKKYFGIYGRYVLVGVAALCWWSIFFPQMVMNESCYRVLDTKEQQVVENACRSHWSQEVSYWEILQEDSENVVLTSKLWEYFKDLGWVE